MTHLNLADYIILAIIGVSVIIGIWRGFLREFISLATLVAAFAISFIFVEDAALYLVPYLEVPSVRAILAFGGLFLATMLIGGLINIIVGQLVKHTGLSGTDRLIGLVFGAVRGAALVALLVLVFATQTPLPEDPWWQESALLGRFELMAVWLRDLLPPDYAQHFVFPHEAVPATESGLAPQSPGAGSPSVVVPPATDSN